MPGLACFIRGEIPISDGMPIIYFSRQFAEAAPIRKRGLEEEIRVLVPKTHAYGLYLFMPQPSIR